MILSELQRTGAKKVSRVLGQAELARIGALFGDGRQPGKRLDAVSIASIADLIASEGPLGALVQDVIGRPARPVRALLLDKSPQANWRLGWHQDRTICVAERIEVEGFGPWTVKDGQIHVQPSTELLARMITLRVHVDPVDEENAPLDVIPGSHLHGRITEQQIEALTASSPSLTCLADAGDVWVYATLIVHGSAKQRRDARRRVLQLDFSTDDLPGGLRWAGSLVAKTAGPDGAPV